MELVADDLYEPKLLCSYWSIQLSYLCLLTAPMIVLSTRLRYQITRFALTTTSQRSSRDESKPKFTVDVFVRELLLNVTSCQLTKSQSQQQSTNQTKMSSSTKTNKNTLTIKNTALPWAWDLAGLIRFTNLYWSTMFCTVRPVMEHPTLDP